MRIHLIYCLAFMTAGFASLGRAAEPNACQLVELAQRENEAGHYKESIQLLDRAIAADSKLADAYRERGWVKSRSLKDDDGLADCNQAIELEPKAAQNWLNRAQVRINRREDYKGAIEDLTKAMELAPKDWKNHNVRGFAKLQLQLYEEAILDFNEAIALNPKVGNPVQYRGECYYCLGEYERSIVDYERAIELEKSPNVRQYYTAGECYYELKKYRQAIDSFEKAFDGSRQDAWTYGNLGNCHFQLSEYDKALENYDASLKIDAKDAVVHQSRGMTLKQLGQAAEADNEFATAKELGYSAP